MKNIAKKSFKYVLSILVILNSGTIVGQCGEVQDYPPEPCCSAVLYSTPSVTCINLAYTLVFDDEFTGDALDVDKWNQLRDPGVHGYDNLQSYFTVNEQNLQFQHPGVAIVNRSVTPFTARRVDYDADTKTETDHQQNLRTWRYTSAELSSQYQFPFTPINSPSPSGYTGICVLDAVLPTQGYGGGPGDEGIIWPAFWMFGYGLPYGEIDDFEFFESQYDCTSNIHSPIWHNTCGYDADPGSTPFGNGAEHTFTLIYSNQEIDWYVDNTQVRLDTKYYFTLLQTGLTYPLTCLDNNTQNISEYQSNLYFPEIPMWLVVNDGVQPQASGRFSPTYFYIKSIKYYENTAFNCNQANTLTATSSYFSNNGGNNYNCITGTTVTVDASTNGPITIPLQRPSNANCMGNLKVIAQNSIIIKGTFKNQGYLVLKTDPNVCDEYSGPLPVDINQHRPIKRNDTNTNKNGAIKYDSLSLQVKNSVTKGQISVNVTNISTNELNQAADVMVYDMLGRLVYSGKMQATEGNILPINLSAYASGVYLVMLKTNDMLLQRKIILEK